MDSFFPFFSYIPSFPPFLPSFIPSCFLLSFLYSFPLNSSLPSFFFSIFLPSFLLHSFLPPSLPPFLPSFPLFLLLFPPRYWMKRFVSWTKVTRVLPKPSWSKSRVSLSTPATSSISRACTVLSGNSGTVRDASCLKCSWNYPRKRCIPIIMRWDNNSNNDDNNNDSNDNNNNSNSNDNNSNNNNSSLLRLSTQAAIRWGCLS